MISNIAHQNQFMHSPQASFRCVQIFVQHGRKCAFMQLRKLS